jgi:RNA polymerase sigma-70 factor (ECF subfamily)
MTLPMTGEEREVLEAALRRLHAAGDLQATATQALEAYGPEVLGFLVNLTGARQDAGEVFSMFCEDVWSGLPAFRFESSFRTWAYTLARHAAHRFREDPHARRRLSLSDCPQILEIEQRLRTTTVTYLQTGEKDRVRAFREGLEPDDQALLVLRIDRDMPWTDVARVFLGGESPNDDDAVARKAASLRKRFERVKATLRTRLAAERKGSE